MKVIKNSFLKYLILKILVDLLDLGTVYGKMLLETIIETQKEYKPVLSTACGQTEVLVVQIMFLSNFKRRNPHPPFIRLDPFFLKSETLY